MILKIRCALQVLTPNGRERNANHVKVAEATVIHIPIKVIFLQGRASRHIVHVKCIKENQVINMRTLNELKSHFQNMSIEEIEVETKNLMGKDNLLFSAGVTILCNRVSGYEFDEFIKTLQV